MTKETNLATKVDNIITERSELGELVFNYITENGLEDNFYNYLIKAEASGVYKQLDIDFIALDYMGKE